MLQESIGKTQAEKQERVLANQEIIISQLPKLPTKLAKVPKGTPAHKGWYVERRQVMESVFESLRGDGGQRLVGLVGHSGSGKTTAASEVARSAEVRQHFADGVVWLAVNEGANARLPSLMLQLAHKVHEDIGRTAGVRPTASDDSVAYIKRCVESGRRGDGLKCLVVADNVWEKEVISELLRTGMSILVSTRDGDLVTDAQGEAVRVDELSEVDAESVLRRAAELSPEARLPDDAVDLMELCGRVAMDLAFIGRWSIVRGRKDRTAWADAASKVRNAIEKNGVDPGTATAESTRTKRRKAILQAGFDDLATGSDDERVQRLYLSLAVFPDGHPFTVKDATVLLIDRPPSSDDEDSVRGVLDILDRWSVIQSVEGTYRMHDAHTGFARESLMDRGYVRRPAVERLVRYISTLETVRSVDKDALNGLWVAAERIGGVGWADTRPYEVALTGMDESDPLLRPSIEAVGNFQEGQNDWKRASSTWYRLLEIEKRELGADHPFVLNTYRGLADCAKHLNHAEEEAEWRGKEREGIPLALARMKVHGASDVEAGLDDADGLSSLASTILDLEPDNTREVEIMLRRCLEIREAKLGQDNEKVNNTLYRLVECIGGAGRLAEAEDLLRRRLEIEETKLGRSHLKVADTLYALGAHSRKAGRLGKAEELLRGCLEIEEANFDKDHIDLSSTLNLLAVCLQEAGRLEEAERLMRRRLAIQEANLGLEDLRVANTLYELGLWTNEAGRLGEAEEYFRRCLRIEEVKLGREDDQVTYTLQELGVCVRDRGRLEEAEALFKRCLAIQTTTPDRNDISLATTWYHLGVCLRKGGRQEEALQSLKDSLRIREAKFGRENGNVEAVLQELNLCLEQDREAKGGGQVAVS